MRREIEQHLIANWSRLFGYAITLSGEREAACDLLQESALHALSTRCSPKNVESIRAWLFRIVRNAWIDRHRREAARAAALQADTLDQDRWHYDDRLIAELTVREGLARIGPIHREIIELVDLHGFRYAEVADILEIPVGTVMSRLSRARLALLDAIGGNVRSLDAARRRTS